MAIVFFTEYVCEFCERFHYILDQLKARRRNSNLKFKLFVLDLYLNDLPDEIETQGLYILSFN